MWRNQIPIWLLLLVLVGCHRDIPEPESKLGEKSVKRDETTALQDVMASPHTSSFEIRHQVNGRNVLVECKLKDVSFQKNHPDKQVVKMVVSVDGQKTQEAHSPVFIIKGLTPGNHTITLEVVNLTNHPYPLKKELQVDIP